MARCLYMTGARPGDVFQNMTGYGLFTGGLGFSLRSRAVGGTDHSRRGRQHQAADATPAGLFDHDYPYYPSYALHLMEVMTEQESTRGSTCNCASPT